MELEIPAGSRFSLEYWGTRGSDERSGMKRRHQKDHHDILQLYVTDPTSSNSNQQEHGETSMVFCSKSALGGENKNTSSTLTLTFTWYINRNYITPHASSSTASNIVFRQVFFYLITLKIYTCLFKTH